MKKGVPHAPEHAWQSPADPPQPYNPNPPRGSCRGGSGYGNGGARANNALRPVSGGLYRTSAFDRGRKKH